MSKRRYALGAFIIFFVAFCIVTTVLKSHGFGVAGEESLDEYIISFTVTDISANSEKYFVQGDTVTSGGLALGTLYQAVRGSPTNVYATNAGISVAVSYPENTRVDLRGTILSHGKNDGGGYMLGGYRHIAPGEAFFVSTEHIDVLIKVTEIVKK